MNQIKHQFYAAALLGQFGLFLSIHCFGQVVQRSLIKMAPKRSKNKKTVLGKSKLKILTYKPEVQQTDLTFIYETCQTSHGGMCLSDITLECGFVLRFLKEIFKTTD